MKKIIVLLTVCSLFVLGNLNGQAQNAKNVSLVFNHTAAGIPLNLTSGTTYTDWQGNDYSISRLQYYISDIILFHDGGQTLPLEDVYVLVNGNTDTYELGQYNLGQLESITFSIGVSAEVNHSDPSLWPIGHPLAPQVPDMHWGWAPGYRFLVLEGDVNTPNSSVNLQYHAVGDEFLTHVSLTTYGVTMDDNLTIPIDADYNKLLNTINTPIYSYVHGGGPTIATIMNNIVTEGVFSISSQDAVGINDAFNGNDFVRNYPNPFTTETTINYSFSTQNEALFMVLNDVQGKTIHRYDNLPASGDVLLSKELNAGIYFCTFYMNNEQAIAKHVIQVVR
jgi:hypothetical protein